MTGKTLSHYEILDRIDAGGMGVVYRARDLRLDRTVAIKVLKPEAMGDADRMRRFILEAKAASGLNHPNIVTIYEIDRAASPEGATDFIAMEYVEGRPLDRAITEGGLAPAVALEYATQIADALGTAHAAGIVHRDVKPANIMVTTTGRIKLLDFGLAKLSETDHPLGAAAAESPTESARPRTQRGIILGTVAYMSPEQAQGKPVDARSDVFSLGTVMYEMLAGRRPFQGDSAVMTLAAILHETPPPIRSVRGGVPAELERIVERCLRKEREARYASATQLRADLTALLPGRAVPLASLASMAGRRAAVLLSLVILVAASAGAWIWWRSSRVRWARTVALPEIARLVEKEDLVAAYRLARKAEQEIPGDPVLERQWLALAWPFSIRSEPVGAMVYFKQYTDPTADWEYAGTTPIAHVRLPATYLRFRVEKDGFDSLEAAREGTIAGEGTHLEFQLQPTGSSPPGMVRVPGGAWSFQGAPAVELTAFWIDAYEVTNRQYKAFLDRGGYEERKNWRHPVVEDKRVLSFEEAMGRFRDRTGRPGPATWELGTYPAGHADLPVGGVSWYEAAAYAEFAGKSLPTIHHWRRAAEIGVSSEIVTVSNFGADAPTRVGTHAGVGPYGTYDMAGNVKEWCSNGSAGRRYILGGAWNEPSYIYATADLEPPLGREPTYGFRCAKYEAPLSESLTRDIEIRLRDYSKEKPVTDAVFSVFRGLYTYDRSELKASVEPGEQAEHWREERVSFDAAYGGERVAARLYLPMNASPPFQTVVYFPGADAEWLRKGQEQSVRWFEFILRSGRAVLFPVYKGTYERAVPGPWSPNKRRDLVIQWSKDLGRSLDYLDRRPDIDRERLAYFGFSLGGTYGPVLSAIEGRLRTAVLFGAGLASRELPPEVDPFNFAPRVRIPVLMLNGRQDFDVLPVMRQSLFRTLGSPEKDKRQVLFDGGHLPPTYHPIIKESLGWLDERLGPIRKR